MDDQTRLSLFEEGRLDSFPHEDHLQVVFALLKTTTKITAIERMSARIRAMAIAGGRPEAFHVTRTVAWAHIVSEAMRTSSAADSSELLAEHPELLRRDLLDDYYSPGILTSDEARQQFTQPDKRGWKA